MGNNNNDPLPNMSQKQEIYHYKGFGVDLGQLKPKFSSNSKIQQEYQSIFDKFLDDDRMFYDTELDEPFNDDDSYDNAMDFHLPSKELGDVDITMNPDSLTYRYLLVIENTYIVGSKRIKTYTEDGAKKHLAKVFNKLFNMWKESDNEIKKSINQKQTKLIKQAVDQAIMDQADYDFNIGPWYKTI